MSEKEKFIEKIVKGMKDNKRSLVQRYGKKAEEIMYSVANKKWKEKMENDKLNENKNPEAEKKVKALISFFVKNYQIKNKEAIALIQSTLKTLDNKEKMEKDKLQEIIKGVIKKSKKQLSEIVNSDAYINDISLKENTRELTDAEYKIAKDFAAKKGGKLAAMGADDKMLYLSLTMPGKTDEVEFKIDKTGKELNEQSNFHDDMIETFDRMEGLSTENYLRDFKKSLHFLFEDWKTDGFDKSDVLLYVENLLDKLK